MAAHGRILVTAGVVGWDEQERFNSDRLADQFAQALRNVLAILACDGASASQVARLTCYVTSIDEYLESAKEIGAAWREIMGRHYPAMAVVEVVRLVERQANVEIEATAVVPE
jgi:enamine deaminase RidA (YjgF/YER057c/UK114 family)